LTQLRRVSNKHLILKNFLLVFFYIIFAQIHQSKYTTVDKELRSLTMWLVGAELAIASSPASTAAATAASPEPASFLPGTPGPLASTASAVASASVGVHSMCQSVILLYPRLSPYLATAAAIAACCARGVGPVEADSIVTLQDFSH
jgi:hypothetical protein